MSLKEETHATMSAPVPYDRLAAAINAYEKAARGDDPADHLQGGPKPGDAPGGLYLANIPMNRGMMAVMREARELPERERQALAWRVMHFGDALEAGRADTRFSEHLKQSDEDGALMVSEPFVRAYAECRFLPSDDDVNIDMDDLFRLAEEHRITCDQRDAERAATNAP